MYQFCWLIHFLQELNCVLFALHSTGSILCYLPLVSIV